MKILNLERSQGFLLHLFFFIRHSETDTDAIINKLTSL